MEEAADVGDELVHVTGLADDGPHADGPRSSHGRLVRVIGVKYYGNIRPDLQYLLRKVYARQNGHLFIRYDEVEF